MADYNTPYRTTPAESTNQFPIPRNAKMVPRTGPDALDIGLGIGSMIPGVGVPASVAAFGKNVDDYATGQRSDLTPADLALSGLSIPLSMLGAGAGSNALKLRAAIPGAEEALQTARMGETMANDAYDVQGLLRNEAIRSGRQSMGIGASGAHWDKVESAIRDEIMAKKIADAKRANYGRLFPEDANRAVSEAEQEAAMHIEKLKIDSRIKGINENGVYAKEAPMYGEAYKPTPESQWLDESMIRGKSPELSEAAARLGKVDPRSAQIMADKASKMYETAVADYNHKKMMSIFGSAVAGIPNAVGTSGALHPVNDALEYRTYRPQ